MPGDNKIDLLVLSFPKCVIIISELMLCVHKTSVLTCGAAHLPTSYVRRVQTQEPACSSFPLLLLVLSTGSAKSHLHFTSSILLVREWIRKLWYIYTMEYYSAIKNNAFESVLMRWMKLEPIIQSEVSQKEKHQYSILTHIYGI